MAEAAEIQACVSGGLHRDPNPPARRRTASPELLFGTLVKVVGVDPMNLGRRQFTPGRSFDHNRSLVMTQIRRISAVFELDLDPVVVRIDARSDERDLCPPDLEFGAWRERGDRNVERHHPSVHSTRPDR